MDRKTKKRSGRAAALLRAMLVLILACALIPPAAAADGAGELIDSVREKAGDALDQTREKLQGTLDDVKTWAEDTAEDISSHAKDAIVNVVEEKVEDAKKKLENLKRELTATDAPAVTVTAAPAAPDQTQADGSTARETASAGDSNVRWILISAGGLIAAVLAVAGMVKRSNKAEKGNKFDS